MAVSGAGCDSAFDAAKEFLRKLLADGPVAAAKVAELAKTAGIANKTLQRASNDLKVQKQKTGMADGWKWSLPPKMATPAESAQQNNLAIFGKYDHLREPEDEIVEVEL
jgi:hypothetical protein